MSAETRRSRVLVVNDHEWSGRSLETVLGAHDFETRLVFTAGRAEELVANWRPDAVILDTQLPDMDGRELCGRLRHPEVLGERVPVIITTAAPTGRLERLRAAEAGAVDFFPFPIDGELLIFKLKRLIEIQGAASSVWDPVSGCYTERGLYLRAAEMASQAARAGSRVCCVRLRGDGVTAAARQVGRRSDVFATLGPEDVAALGTVGDEAEAGRFANRLTVALDDWLASSSAQPRISAGYAVAGEPEAVGDIENLVHQAETALAETDDGHRCLGHHELIR